VGRKEDREAIHINFGVFYPIPTSPHYLISSLLQPFIRNLGLKALIL
jgi:hypothetical protein